MRVKESIPILYDHCKWLWDDNLKHWYAIIDDKHTAFVWCEILEESESIKLSKSNGEKKVLWDGICMGVTGGPEPCNRPGPILSWIRNKYENYMEL